MVWTTFCFFSAKFVFVFKNFETNYFLTAKNFHYLFCRDFLKLVLHLNPRIFEEKFSKA